MRRAPISFAVSAPPSVCPHVSAHLAQDGLLFDPVWCRNSNLTLAMFTKICRESPNLVKKDKNIGHLT
jgi:hypothetical protein